MNAKKTTSYSPLSLTIDTKKRAIVMTKKFEKASRRVGTDEYDLLQKARADYPKYRVETRTTNAKPNSLKGLNYDFMKLYIKKHDAEKLDHFNLLTARLEGIGSSPYQEVKDWFVKNFPEIAEYESLRDALMAA